MATLESTVRPRPFLVSTCDRRTHGRASLALPVLVDTQRDWVRLSSVDLSASGVAVTGSVHAAVGALVDIYFELPCGVAIETKAKVVRTTAERSALEFVGLSHDALVALRAHCRVNLAH